jgi:hypothetical protein
MACTLTRLEFSAFIPVGTPKHPCVCSSCWQRRGNWPSHCGCLSDYPQMPRRIWTNAADHDETCRGVHWISWREFWAIYYKCTLSAITHKLNVSVLMLIWTFFLFVVCGSRSQNLSAPFSYTRYKMLSWNAAHRLAPVKETQLFRKWLSLRHQVKIL